ncbi:unnamed protein product, partial [Staurois parvus]
PDYSLPAALYRTDPTVTDPACLTLHLLIHPSIPPGSPDLLTSGSSPWEPLANTPTTDRRTQEPRPGLRGTPSPSPPSGALVNKYSGA